jgi:peptidoglycan/xylan/chitin deacetylase (PgdA/CDA1 family)
MSPSEFWERARGKYQRMAYTAFFRDLVRMRNEAALISFSFDDFPRTAYQLGGSTLRTHGVRGTYYAALGLMGSDTPVGEIFSREDLYNVVSDGHELGCHTFAHCHAWNTAPSAFEESIIENARCLHELLPDVSFKTLSYPIAGPRPHSKRRAARHFPCCRFGGQTHNVGVIDRSLLSAFFLEQSKHDPDAVKRAIDKNAEDCGWLIFATHDVCETPTRFGCTPGFFEDVVRYATRSGARILPVGEAFDVVCGKVSAEAGSREERSYVPRAESTATS